MAAYSRLCSNRKDLHPIEVKLLGKVFTRGTPEEQRTAVDGIAFIGCRQVRRVLIDILKDTNAPLDCLCMRAEKLQRHVPEL